MTAAEGDRFWVLLREAQAGVHDAQDELYRLVNEEPREQAARIVRGRYGIAQPPSLVNDLYLKLFAGGSGTTS